MVIQTFRNSHEDILVSETIFRFTVIFHEYRIVKPEIYQLVW